MTRVFTPWMKCAVLAFLVSIGTAWRCSAVELTIDPGSWGLNGNPSHYAFGWALYYASGVQTANVPADLWMPWFSGAGASLGEVMLTNEGGGNYGVQTRVSASDSTPAPGIIATGGSNPRIEARIISDIAVSWAPQWQGGWSLDWTAWRTSVTNALNLPVAHGFEGWWAASETTGRFFMNVHTNGQIEITTVNPDLPIQGASNPLRSPSPSTRSRSRCPVARRAPVGGFWTARSPAWLLASHQCLLSLRRQLPACRQLQRHLDKRG